VVSSIRWGLVGTSDFALDWIAPALTRAEGSILAAVISRDASRAAAAAARVGAAHAVTSIESADTSLIDGVVLVTPNSAHAAGAIAALRRGLHVIVEKPMAHSVAECKQMIAAAEASGRMLAVAHCMEWAPPVAAARELLASGAVGSVRSARIGASFLAEPGSLRREGVAPATGEAAAFGALYDMGVHAIDAITRLLGPVARVQSVRTDSGDGDAVAELELASGVNVHLSSRWSADENYFEIVGERGVLRSREWWGRDFAGHLELERSGVTEQIALTRANVYDAQFAHLSASALSGTIPVTSSRRGAENIRVVQAVVDAARNPAH
jgi:predicted dehydrogenase